MHMYIYIYIYIYMYIYPSPPPQCPRREGPLKAGEEVRFHRHRLHGLHDRNNSTPCSRMPRACSSDQPRVMVGLSGWSAFNGVSDVEKLNLSCDAIVVNHVVSSGDCI